MQTKKFSRERISVWVAKGRGERTEEHHASQENVGNEELPYCSILTRGKCPITRNLEGG